MPVPPQPDQPSDQREPSRLVSLESAFALFGLKATMTVSGVVQQGVDTMWSRSWPDPLPS